MEIYGNYSIWSKFLQGLGNVTRKVVVVDDNKTIVSYTIACTKGNCSYSFMKDIWAINLKSCTKIEGFVMYDCIPKLCPKCSSPWTIPCVQEKNLWSKDNKIARLDEARCNMSQLHKLCGTLRSQPITKENGDHFETSFLLLKDTWTGTTKKYSRAKFAIEAIDILEAMCGEQNKRFSLFPETNIREMLKDFIVYHFRGNEELKVSAILNGWCGDIKRTSEKQPVFLDTEFVTDESDTKLCVIQLCFRDEILTWHNPKRCKGLIRLFSHKSVVFVGNDLKIDVELIKTLLDDSKITECPMDSKYTNSGIGGQIDFTCQEFLYYSGMNKWLTFPVGLAHFWALITQKKLSKDQQCSNWENDLSQAQLDYAAMDVAAMKIMVDLLANGSVPAIIDYLIMMGKNSVSL